MTEPDVTLTDFGIAVLSAGLAIAALGTPLVGGGYAGLFAALGLAALTGALWHGWFSGQNRSGIGGALWLATLLAVGLANLFLWWIAGDLFISLRGLLSAVAVGQFAVFAVLAAFASRSFLLASAFSLPPTLVLLAGFAQAQIWVGAAGLAVALIGAVLQAAKVGAPPLRLGHNGLYHVIQALAFVLVFLSAPAVSALLTKG